MDRYKVINYNKNYKNRVNYGKKIIKTISIAIMSSVIFFGGIVKSENNGKYTRYSGYNRVNTSVESAKTYNSDTLVIAPAYSYQDAISAMNIANRYNGRLVLANKDSSLGIFDSDKTIKNVFIVGGDSGDRQISNKIDDRFRSRAKIKRIIGKNIYETNRKTLELSGYKTVGVATGRVYADALSAYSIIREEGIGIMLVDGEKAYNASGYTVKYTFGGKSTVRQDGGYRISGRDRYDTSNKIARKTAYKNIVFVDGRNYADSMSAINITNSKNSDILLVPRVKNQETISLAQEANELFVVGGSKSVEDAYLKQAIDGTLVSNNTIVNYADGFIRIVIPSTLAGNIAYKPINSVAEDETAITLYSKYHFDRSSNKNEPEGYICDIAVVDSDFSYPSTYVEIGRVYKNGVEKKVLVFLSVEPSFSDQSPNSINTFKNNYRATFGILRNNIQAIDGAVYKKSGGDPLKKYEMK